MKKLYRLAFILLSSFFILAHIAYDADARISRINIESRAVSERGLGFTAIGELPIVSFPSNAALEEEINDRIDEIYNNEVFGVRRPAARTFVFSHSTHRTDDIFTILIDVSSAMNRPAQSTFGITIDLNLEQIISLSDIDALGQNALKVVRQATLHAISQNSNFTSVNLNGLDYNRSFYLDGTSVVLLFNEGEIAPVHFGVQYVEVDLNSIASLTVYRDDILIREDFYNLNLIPLRIVAEAMGYEVSWHGSTRTTRIARDNFETSITLHRNSYYRIRGATRSLEAAPTQIVVNGVLTTFVPLSFFDQILDVVYSEDSDGNIVFSSYRPL